MNRINHPLSLLFAFLALAAVLGCYSRYEMRSSRLPKVKDMEGLEFILLNANAPVSDVWTVSNPDFQQDGMQLRIKRASETFGIKLAQISTNAERRASQDLVLIYLNPDLAKTLADTATLRIPYEQIKRIEVFEPDAGKVVGLVFAGLGGCAGIVLVSLIIACNCPTAYTETPEGRMLEGSLYSGAIYPQLERHDYLPLQHAQIIDHQYRIRLANQEAQVQYTDMLSLELIDHAPGQQVLMDQNGAIHTIGNPQMPLRAEDAVGQNLFPLLEHPDEQTYAGLSEGLEPEPVATVMLDFERPAGAREAKLVLRAKNAQWLDQTWFAFMDELGVYADAVDRKYRNKSAAANRAWAEKQKIPLTVWIETGAGKWKKAGSLELPGASAFRDMVLPITLPENAGKTVRLRLESGFRFWEIDYAAIDFSADQPLQQSTLRPVSATDQHGADCLAALTDDDQSCYTQIAIGDEAAIRFDAPPLAPGMERSLFLHAKGHYTVLHQPTGKRPGLLELKSWEKENALPRLSLERWRSAQALSATE